jgi:acyl-coenzyme A synthetase/AMP-(fatty) acid ligase
MYNHKTIVQILRHWSHFPFNHDKPNIIASKGTHISGSVFPLSMITKGVLGICLPQVNKEILIKTVDKYKPGTVFAFPSFLLALGTVDADGYDVTSIETILTGGSPITGEMFKAYMSLPGVKTVIFEDL